jgi:hypothetical protein
MDDTSARFPTLWALARSAEQSFQALPIFLVTADFAVYGV